VHAIHALLRLDDLPQRDLVGLTREAESAAPPALAEQHTFGHERLEDLAEERSGDPEDLRHVPGEVVLVVVALGEPRQGSDGVFAGS